VSAGPPRTAPAAEAERETAAGASLRALQRRLSRWIRADAPPAAEEAEALLRGDSALRAQDRLAVYANAWRVRIQRVLRDDFPATAALAGDALFEGATRAYLAVHPTRSFTLRDAGEAFASFLAGHPDAAAVRAAAPLAPELARLEWAFVEAFDAPDAPVLAREALAAVAPEAWAGLRLETTPSLRLLQLAGPAQRVKQACDADGAEAAREVAAALPPEPTRVRVWRRDERVFHRAMDAAEADALGAVVRGEPFGRVCERVARHVGDEAAPARAAACLEAWLEDGLLSRLAG